MPGSRLLVVGGGQRHDGPVGVEGQVLVLEAPDMGGQGRTRRIIKVVEGVLVSGKMCFE